ncbi:hypothetical protein D3C73_1240760 [compost metagenome]
MVDRRIGLHEVQHHLQLGLGLSIEFHALAREADLRLFDLFEVLGQQLRHATLVIVERFTKLDGQQANFRDPAIAGKMPDDRASPVHQATDQTARLDLRAVEQHVATADPDRTEIDVSPPRLPRRSRRQQGRRAATDHRVVGFQTKRRLLPSAAHELARTEIGDRLSQATLEFVPFDRPLDALQTSLESERHRGKAGKHTEQG